MNTFVNKIKPLKTMHTKLSTVYAPVSAPVPAPVPVPVSAPVPAPVSAPVPAPFAAPVPAPVSDFPLSVQDIPLSDFHQSSDFPFVVSDI